MRGKASYEDDTISTTAAKAIADARVMVKNLVLCC
jgi:hypothetical protein